MAKPAHASAQAQRSGAIQFLRKRLAHAGQKRRLVHARQRSRKTRSPHSAQKFGLYTGSWNLLSREVARRESAPTRETPQGRLSNELKRDASSTIRREESRDASFKEDFFEVFFEEKQ
jgi:hypothetical protein